MRRLSSSLRAGDEGSADSCARMRHSLATSPSTASVGQVSVRAGMGARLLGVPSDSALTSESSAVMGYALSVLAMRSMGPEYSQRVL